jgi:hypothetical protein
VLGLVCGSSFIGVAGFGWSPVVSGDEMLPDCFLPKEKALPVFLSENFDDVLGIGGSGEPLFLCV